MALKCNWLVTWLAVSEANPTPALWVSREQRLGYEVLIKNTHSLLVHSQDILGTKTLVFGPMSLGRGTDQKMLKMVSVCISIKRLPGRWQISKQQRKSFLRFDVQTREYSNTRKKRGKPDPRPQEGSEVGTEAHRRVKREISVKKKAVVASIFSLGQDSLHGWSSSNLWTHGDCWQP